MLTKLKLHIQLESYLCKRHIEDQAKNKWYYNRLPKRIVAAFTLAEVLITLLIIGVVASIIIPNLIADTQMQEFKVAWKKQFAELSHASKLVYLDNGGSFLNLCNTVDHNCLRNKYLPYLNYTKSCDVSNANGNCWQSYGGSGVILSNGNLVRFYWNNSDCDAYWGSITICGSIAVDINGFKEPNKMGKDKYQIVFLRNKIIPVGSAGSYPMATDCTDSGTGMGCSALYLIQ